MRNSRKPVREALPFLTMFALAIALLGATTAYSFTSPLIIERGTISAASYFAGFDAPLTATATGTLSGTAIGSAFNLSDENYSAGTIPGVPGLSLGQNFNVGATFSVSKLGVTFGPYGVVGTLDFNAAAPAPSIAYNLPYNLNVGGIPGSVSPGQTIPLSTTFDWTGTPSITSTQTIKFSTKTSVWMDIPLDGLGAAITTTTQTPEPFLFNTAYSDATLNTTATIPSLNIPLVGEIGGVKVTAIPAPVGNQIDTSDFSNYPATATLSGIRDLNTSGTPWLSASVDSDHAYFGNNGVSADAWGISGDLIPILGEALIEASPAFPPLAAVGGALKILDIPFSIPTEISMDIRRADWIYVELAELPSVTVSDAQTIGINQTLTFDDVPLTYRYMTGSDYWYDFTFSIGAGVDLWIYEKTVSNTIQLGSMYLGGASTGLQTGTSLFDLSISGIDVVAGTLTFDRSVLQLRDLSSLPYAFAPRAGDPPLVAPGDTTDFFSDPVPVATPEPGTMMLLGIGLSGLAGYARRRAVK